MNYTKISMKNKVRYTILIIMQTNKKLSKILMQFHWYFISVKITNSVDRNNIKVLMYNKDKFRNIKTKSYIFIILTWLKIYGQVSIMYQ